MLSRARCGECGYAMQSMVHHASGRHYNYYCCRRHHPAWRASVRKVDTAVWKHLISLYTPDIIDDIVAALRADVPDTLRLVTERDAIADKIISVERRHDRLLQFPFTLVYVGQQKRQPLLRQRHDMPVTAEHFHPLILPPRVNVLARPLPLERNQRASV
jgi:hypothetical protein